ncbi:serine/threonine protein kinase [Paracidovorax konjaci]|uniref:Protein kinase domain-containing protein n=1 Tax=Paracidovorax konjaci TaxID=32040 RepID=A0A1I1WBJ5_9BURK|nr:serine/threonine-protein kinase [Paracidovorax konjaci]SFD92527.1 Protein kinase domain-containing protein [Paracidovorax konjaci]
MKQASPSYGSPVSTLAPLLDPGTPEPFDGTSESWNALSTLGRERRRKCEMRSAASDMVLSPGFVKVISQKITRSDLLEKLAALRPGSTEVGEGFRALALERPLGGVSSQPQGMRKLGAGVSGTAYAVRLSKDFVSDGKNFGRDFVFKAMLCIDPRRLIPDDLYRKDDCSPEEAIEGQKSRIRKEYQMAASLKDTSQVMRVHGLVQIDDQFGILSEKIEGPTVFEVIRQSRRALEVGDVSPEDYLALGRVMLADVLIGASRFADEGIVHQDISHNNIIYDRNQKMFRLIDMGKGARRGSPAAWAPRATSIHVSWRTTKEMCTARPNCSCIS